MKQKTLEEFIQESKKEVSKSRWNDNQVFSGSDKWLALIAKKKITMKSPLVENNNETT